jgi:acetyl esterase/lipase
MVKHVAVLVLLALSWPLFAEDGKSFDAAAAFGARPSVWRMHLSPDGQSVVYLSPSAGQGSVAYTLSLSSGGHPKSALVASGKPDRLQYCQWVSNDRLVCNAYAVQKDPMLNYPVITRMVAVNADGSNFQVLSRRDSVYAHGLQFGGGYVIDSLPAEDGAVLMTRMYVPDDKLGTRFGSSARGLGVDRIDTRSLSVKQVEAPRPDATEYISDGLGTVRIVGMRRGTGTDTNHQDEGVIDYLFRPAGSNDWKKLSEYNYLQREGFNPYAVDRDLNVAYGLKKKDGRLALYTVTLDGSLQERLIYSNPDVDVDDLIRIGRRGRVVGVSYVTDTRQSVFFSPEIQQLITALHKALPQQPILRVVDSSADESRLLVFAGSDADPGVYYIFDRKSHQLQTFLVVRSALEGVKLASVRSITYPATDGTLIPAYLTLPPGAENAKGLPAIVLPHGGPSARDEWGFDWLSQFYAARGFAVLQPQFRGSAGYGDAWFRENGFHSWQIAVGDVLAGGRWLVSQGIANPSRLAVVGWSYGGYAALQSAVLDPSVFKAVVAIAPVTDLGELREQWRRFSNYQVVSNIIGDGPHVKEGSPAQHADKIKVPVLLFHGEVDSNVSIEQSKRMCSALKTAGGSCELVTWLDLDHQLDDAAARTLMLRKSDEFLRTTLGK